MKIEQSTVQLASAHAAIDKSAMTLTTTAWSGALRLPADTVKLSDQGRSALLAADAANIDGDAEDDFSSGVDPRFLLFKMLVEDLTGVKIDLVSLRLKDGVPVTATHGAGTETTRTGSHYQSEQTAFAAQGTIKTADGQQIDFKLSLAMRREHLDTSTSVTRTGDAVDPLALNFSAGGLELGGEKFDFDLNADGAIERISFVGANSAFLALDKNADGKIGDGRELFGPSSGNGFSELAAFDLDHNYWIDANDPIYQALRLWSRDSQGKDQIATLAEKNVGAIYLGHADTPFDLRSAQNQLDGKIRSSGVYVTETGGVGSVQQVDLIA